MGEDEDREFEPESEGSLEQFEEELLKEEKKKARSKSLTTVIFLVLLGGGGFYAYTNYFAPKEEPLPPVRSAALNKKGQPAAEQQQKEEDQWVADEEEKTPAEDAVGEKTAETEQPAPAAGTAKVEAPKEKVVQKKLPEMASPEMASTKPQPKKEPEKAAITEKAPEPKPEPQPKPQVVAKAESPVKKAEEKAIEKKAEPAATTPSSVVTDARTYTLQAGFFAVPKNAEVMMERLEKLGLTPTSKKTAYSSRRVSVWEGFYKFRELAQDMAELLAGQGFKPKVVLTGPGNYSLKIGEYGSEAAADATVRSLEERGFSVRLESGSGVVNEATIIRIEKISGKQRLDEVRAILKENNIENFPVSR